MSKLITILTLLYLPVVIPQTGLLERTKMQSLPLSPLQQYALHFLVGLMISRLGGGKKGVLLAVIAGLAKELFDEYLYSGFDWLDWACTCIGACVKQIK